MKFSKPSLRPMRWASAYKMTEGRRQRLLHSWLRGEVALDPSSVHPWDGNGREARGGEEALGGGGDRRRGGCQNGAEGAGYIF